MGFFSRPNLDDLQFKQTIGDKLTLSGETIIHQINGLKFRDENGNLIGVNVSGGIDGDVLTKIGNELVLVEGGSGGTSIYNGKTPVSIDLGGWKVGDELSGKTITHILEKLLVPTQYPTLTNPTYTFELYDTSDNLVPQSKRILEVGTKIDNTQFKVKAIFNKGRINPLYSSGGSSIGYRSGDVTKHTNRTFFGVSFEKTVFVEGYINGIQTVNYNLSEFEGNPSFRIQDGYNWIYSSASYGSGVQPKDSDLGDFDSPLNGGTTQEKYIMINGIYPYFFGSSLTNPTQMTFNDLIQDSNTNKVVDVSDGSITINFNTGNTDNFIWFAVPHEMAIKDKENWKISELNKGNIGSPSDLFNQFTLVEGTTINWEDIEYELYVSNYTTTVNEPMVIS